MPYLFLIPLLLICVWGIVVRFSNRYTPIEKKENFLLLIKLAVTANLPVEKIILETSSKKDNGISPELEHIAQRIEQGDNFIDATAKEGNFIPKTVLNTLRIGVLTGKLKDFLPLCTEQLKGKKDIDMPWNSAFSRMGDLFWGLPVIVFIIPQFKKIINELLPGYDFFLLDTMTMIVKYCLCFLLLLFFLYGINKLLARLKVFKGFMSRIEYFLPWNRYNIKKYFVKKLCILLKTGISEDKALLLAAETTANSVIIDRANKAAKMLQAGNDFIDVLVRVFDSEHEFAWRTRNLLHSKEAFAQSMTRYCIFLDLRTFKVVHFYSNVFYVGTVLLNGLMVGFIAISIFNILREMIKYSAS